MCHPHLCLFLLYFDPHIFHFEVTHKYKITNVINGAHKTHFFLFHYSFDFVNRKELQAKKGENIHFAYWENWHVQNHRREQPTTIWTEDLPFYLHNTDASYYLCALFGEYYTIHPLTHLKLLANIQRMT